MMVELVFTERKKKEEGHVDDGRAGEAVRRKQRCPMRLVRVLHADTFVSARDVLFNVRQRDSACDPAGASGVGAYDEEEGEGEGEEALRAADVDASRRATHEPAFSRFCAAHLDEAARLAEIPRLYPFDELRPEEVAKLRRVFQIMWTTTKRDVAKVTCSQVEREQAAAAFEVRLQKLLESESAEAESAEAVDAPYEDE